MNMDSHISPGARGADSPQTLKWTVHPLRESPLKAALFWLILTVVIWAVYWNAIPAFSRGAAVLFTAAAAALLLLAVNSFYLPTHFYIDSTGAGFQRWSFHKHITWTRVRSASADKTGLFLSSFPVRSRIENFRGLYLYFRGNREAVIAAVRRYKPGLAGLPKDEGKPEAPLESELLGLKEDEGGW